MAMRGLGRGITWNRLGYGWGTLKKYVKTWESYLFLGWNKIFETTYSSAQQGMRFQIREWVEWITPTIHAGIFTYVYDKCRQI